MVSQFQQLVPRPLHRSLSWWTRNWGSKLKKTSSLCHSAFSIMLVHNSSAICNEQLRKSSPINRIPDSNFWFLPIHLNQEFFEFPSIGIYGGDSLYWFPHFLHSSRSGITTSSDLKFGGVGFSAAHYKCPSQWRPYVMGLPWRDRLSDLGGR